MDWRAANPFLEAVLKGETIWENAEPPATGSLEKLDKDKQGRSETIHISHSLLFLRIVPVKCLSICNFSF